MNIFLKQERIENVVQSFILDIRSCSNTMSLWRNKTNRTILISSIFLTLALALIIFIAVYDVELNPITGLMWLFSDAGAIIIVGLLFWIIYFNLLLLVGSIREKMDALPGWTEVIICALITLLPAIFLGNLDNFWKPWIVFGVTALGVILISLWFLMSSTARDETSAKS